MASLRRGNRRNQVLAAEEAFTDRFHRNGQGILLLAVDNLDRNRASRIRLVLVVQVNVEALPGFGIHDAVDTDCAAGSILHGKHAVRHIRAVEQHIVVAVVEGASAVLPTLRTFGIGSRKHGNVNLVAAHVHAYGDIQLPEVGCEIVMRNHDAIVGKVAFVVEDHVLGVDLGSVRPDLRDVAALGNMGVSRHVHGLACLIHFHVASVRDIERSVVGDIDLVVRTLRGHFRLGGAVTPNEFVLAVDGHERVHRGRIEVEVADILVDAGHTRIIGVITVRLAVRHPAPVTRIGRQAGSSGKLVRRGIPLVVIYAVKLLVRSLVHQILVRRPRTAVVEADIEAQAARALDNRRAQFQREVPLPRSRSRIVRVLDLDRLNVAQGAFQLFLRSIGARLVEARFVVSLADIRTHTDIRRDIVGTAHVQPDGQAVERPGLIVIHVDIQHGHILPRILVCLHAKVVLRNGSRKLERGARFSFHVGKLAVAFHHEVVLRTFLESTNLYIVELGGHAGHVGIPVTRIKGEFGRGRMLNRIPIDSGFVFAVRRVPHNFCGIGTHVTDSHVLDIRALDGIERRKAERGLRAVHLVFRTKVVRIVYVESADEEVVGRTCRKVPEHNLVAHTGGRVVGSRGRSHRLFTFAVIDADRTAYVEFHHNHGGVHAHVLHFHADFRGAGAVNLLRGEHTGTHEGRGSIDTGFGEVVFFPASRTRIPVICRSGSLTAEESTHGRVVLVACAREVLAFGVGRTVVRVGIVLIADAQNERYIPGVHAQQVVQLVDAQLVHFGSLPFRRVHMRKSEALFLNVGRHIRIGKHFENVTCLIAVVNPGTIRKHRIPRRVILDGSLFPANTSHRKIDRGRALPERHVAQVVDHACDTVFDRVQPFIFRKAIFRRRLGLVGKDELVEGVGRIGIGVRPARVLAVLQEALVVRDEPATLEATGTVIHIFLSLHKVAGTDHVIGVILLARRIEERHRSKRHVVVEFVVAVVSRARPTGSDLVMRIGLTLGQGLRKSVHLLGDHDTAIGKGLVSRIFGKHLTGNGQARGRLTTDIGTDFTQTHRSRERAAPTERRVTLGRIQRQFVLVLGPAPPAVVRAKITHREGHIVNDPTRTLVGTQDKVRPVLRFAEHIGNTVGIHRLALVVGIEVIVRIRIGCRHHGRHHERVHLRLRFLQVVAAVVVTTFKGSRKGLVKRIDTGIRRSAAIQRMACRVEPRFAIAATVDAVELECRGAHHGIDLVTDDKGARNIVAHLDTQTRVGGKAHIAQLANLDTAGLAGNAQGITILLVGSRIRAGINLPCRRDRLATRGESSRRRGRKGIAVDIHHFEGRRAAHVIELLLGILLEVARLVQADRGHTVVQRIQVGLVQRIGNKLVRGICRRGPVLRNRILRIRIGHEMVKDRRIPRQGPDRTNQIVRGRLFLTSGHGGHRCK